MMKVKKMRRGIRLLSCMLLLSVLLTGCGIITFPDRDHSDTTTTASPSDSADVTTKVPDTTDAPTPTYDPDAGYNTAKKQLETLRTQDFEGSSVFILELTTHSNYVPDSDSVSTEMDAASLRRNRLVEEKYNVHIFQRVAQSRDDLFTLLESSVNSGEYLADLVAAPAGDLGILKNKEVLYNLNSLPFTDYSASYFNQEAMEQASGGNVTYGASGSLTDNVSNAYVCFFNKDLIPADTDSPYTLWQNGKWTWEALLSYEKAAESEISLLAAEQDEVGLTNTLFLSTGAHYLTAGVGKTPTLTYANDANNALMDGLRSLTLGKTQVSQTENESLVSFAAGRAVFYIGSLSTARRPRSMPENWGLLPLPSHSESAEVCNVYNEYATVICVPKEGIDVACTGMVLQAMFAASDSLMKQSYRTQYKNRYLEDGTAIAVLDAILSAKFCGDFAEYFGSDYPSLVSAGRNYLWSAVLNGKTLKAGYNGYEERVVNSMTRWFS